MSYRWRLDVFAAISLAICACGSDGSSTGGTRGAGGTAGQGGGGASTGSGGTTGSGGSTTGSGGSTTGSGGSTTGGGGAKDGGAGAAGSTGTGGSTTGTGATGGSGGSSGKGGTGGATGGTAGTGTGGGAGTGGSTGGTGGSGTGGTGGASGTGGTGTGGTGGGACDPGTTTTEWATSCPTAPTTACTAGEWKDPGSNTNDPLQCESAHFAVHSPAGTITAQQCADATKTLEEVIWPTYFGSPIFFPEPYCTSATKWKAALVIHSDYGLTGGGWGNGYMGMWVGPGATADPWGLAHEFMHAVQAQTKGLSCGGAASNNFCGWIHESHANFMPHQLSTYRASVHCSEMLDNAPHIYLGSTRDRYCNWQFMEFLKDKYCYKAVNDIWLSATASNDPFTNIATTRGWNTSQLNDFFGEWAMHNVTWDYQDPGGGSQGPTYRKEYGAITDTSKGERRLRLTRLDPLDAPNRRYVVTTQQAPQRWGYNVVRLHPDAGATEVTVTFRGVVQAAANSDWRWGLVATDAAMTTSRYSALQRGADGSLTFCVKAGEPLFLVVVGTPSVQQKIVWDELYPKIYRFPYMIQLAGAEPDGFQPSAPNPSANGMRWANGGGWVASGATVAQGAYVGPYAAVLGGTVGATARIEDHAVILSGSTVTSGTVGGLTVLPTGATVNGSAKVLLGWPYGPAYFERPQTIGDSAVMLGDLELRGASTNKTSGSYCGFVDMAVNNNCGMADVTVPPPYAWRP